MAADETSWRRTWKPEFETEPWKVIHADSGVYLIKYYFEEVLCSYKFAVADYERIWIEDVCNETAFSEKAKELNPNIEARSTYLLKHLCDCLSGSSASNVSVKPDAEKDQLILCLKSKLPAGIPFCWEFHCASAGNQMMKKYLVFPLLSMVGELQRRQEELVKILKKKDYEIEEYKNTGAVLSRKSFETQPFLHGGFTQRMTVSQEFLHVVENCADKACNKDNQELYKQVIIKRKWIECKNQNPMAITEEETCTLGTVGDTCSSQGFALSSMGGNPGSSWDTKLPPSLLAEAETSPAKRSPLSSPTKSPIKTSPEKSPSQDTELKRREDLRKRLAEEAEKKKSKKRKKLKI